MKREIKYIGLLLVILFACQPIRLVSPISLTPFEQNQQWGYKDSQNKIVITPRYQLANEFSPHGLAAVVDAKGWLYINAQGAEVIRPFVYDNGPDYFQEGRARFVKDHKFGYFDETGKIVIAPQFDFAYPFENGKAKVGWGCKFITDGEHQRVEGGTWKTIDHAGHTVP